MAEQILSIIKNQNKERKQPFNYKYQTIKMPKQIVKCQIPKRETVKSIKEKAETIKFIFQSFNL